MDDPVIIVSCEHGGKHIPQPYRKLFKQHRALLDSHRGYDPGALTLAGRLAQDLGAPLFANTLSRLLVDLNRSIGHPRLFSEITHSLSASEKRHIIESYYKPHRSALQAEVAHRIGLKETVVHIAVHSFTPVLNGKQRSMDIGFLYDPQRVLEKRLCAVWQKAIKVRRPELSIRRNAPYRGTADGLTTALRKIFTSRYLGIELEINQRFFRTHAHAWIKCRPALFEGLAAALAGLSP
jgi:predicted N-formylglutamate amidohydrolase